MPYALTCFDCDGVLVDTEPVVNRVFVALVAEAGPRLDEGAALARFTGVSLAARIAAVRKEHGWAPPADFERDLDARFDAAFRHELRVVPGVVDVVRVVRGPRCVVSNGSRAEMTLKLELVGLLDAFFPHLFTATELPHAKPHPDVYLHATASMGVDPRAAVAIEDSIPGATAALAAGLTVLGFAAGANGDALSRLGATVFARMSELPALLDARR